MEERFELLTVKEFHEKMAGQYVDVYSLKWVKFELQKKYKNSIQFVSRIPKSDTPTINIRPHIMHFRRLVFSYTE